ncbi:MAG: hypothetical protein NC337_04745 [Roseburia sp.]|nr:hypothetical protein [Roseburia sp.]
MNNQETEKIERVGGFFFLLLLGIGLGLPLIISLIITLCSGSFDVGVFLGMAIGIFFMVGFMLLLAVAWGDFTSIFVKRTAKRIEELPYNFNSSFKSRGGMLFIDVENGMIAFISAYNPQKIQVFSASRIDNPKTIASMMSGVRFVFYLDGKKITMYTLLSNRMVSLKSGIGAEAVSKADTFVELLQAAKSRAAMGA